MGMDKTPAPTASTTPTNDGSAQADFDQKVAAAKQAFFVSALNMSWQLAIVVLVPIIGGSLLDDKLDMSPILTIVGFIIASAGLALVLWMQLQKLSPTPKGKAK